MSELPKAYNAAEYEDAIYKRWEESGFFNPDNLKKTKKSFSIVMPPPNATGALHVGHAVMLALEDLMVRYHRMKGDDTLWIPGTDHASIATQNKVEKILLETEGKTRQDLGRAEFLKRVEEYVAASRERIRLQIRKLGSSCDWSREAFTLDVPRGLAVAAVFKKMYEDGLIYRGNRLVNWCPRCQSTLSDDEVEYKEEHANFYYLKYGPFVIATARPETKFLDKVIVVHPKDRRYKKYIGQEMLVPWIEGEVKAKILADESVDPKFGTGAMTITPAHDFNDFAIAQRQGLEIVPIIDEQGNLTAAAGSFAGANAREARGRIIERLQTKGLVEKIDPNYTHNLSVCYRCATPLEPLVSQQWFIDVNKKIPRRGTTLKQLMMEAVKSGKIKITPARFSKVYFYWVNNLRDWCVSRQIWYGHRIPVYYCKRESPNFEFRISNKILNLKSKIENLACPPIVSVERPLQCPRCGNAEPTQDPDTLDTWFSSGLWTFSTLGWPHFAPPTGGASRGTPQSLNDLERFYPTSVLETGYDILFFWVARMILMSTYVLREVPFKKVYLHGLVRDIQGRKMSKSLGNVIDPLEVIPKYGTDALRLALVIGNTPGNDLRLSEEKIAGFRNFTNKLWNISRFILLQVPPSPLPSPSPGRGESERHPRPLRERDGVRGQTPTPQTPADKWILARLQKVIAQTSRLIEQDKFSLAGEELRAFTWEELADRYLEIAKREKGKEEILAYILETILKLWHPFMPFVTEAIWQQSLARGEDNFLMIQSWPKPIKKLMGNFKAPAKVTTKPVVDRARVEQELAEAKTYLALLQSQLANKDFLTRAPAAVVENVRGKLKAAEEKIKNLKPKT